MRFCPRSIRTTFPTCALTTTPVAEAWQERAMVESLQSRLFRARIVRFVRSSSNKYEKPHRACLFVPEGRLTIAQRFIAGCLETITS